MTKAQMKEEALHQIYHVNCQIQNTEQLEFLEMAAFCGMKMIRMAWKCGLIDKIEADKLQAERVDLWIESENRIKKAMEEAA